MCIYIHINIYIYTYIYNYTYICAHTRTHTLRMLSLTRIRAPGFGIRLVGSGFRRSHSTIQARRLVRSLMSETSLRE